MTVFSASNLDKYSYKSIPTYQNRNGIKHFREFSFSLPLLRNFYNFSLSKYRPMKSRKTYLKGKSIFIVSIVVLIITILIVYLTGLENHRGFIANSNIILGIIGIALFVFILYGLYRGIGVHDDFPRYDEINPPEISGSDLNIPEFPSIDFGDEGEGIVASILLWIVMSIALFVLFIFLEGIVLFFLFSLVVMIYWVFFRALRLVFSRSEETKGNFLLSIGYSLGFTALYLGWIFGLVYMTKLF